MKTISLPAKERFNLADLITAEDRAAAGVHRAEIARLKGLASSYSRSAEEAKLVAARSKIMRERREEDLPALFEAAEEFRAFQAGEIRALQKQIEIQEGVRAVAWGYYWNTAMPFAELILERFARRLEKEWDEQQAREDALRETSNASIAWARFYGLTWAPVSAEGYFRAKFEQVAQVLKMFDEGRAGMMNKSLARASLLSDPPADFLQPVRGLGLGLETL